MQELSLLTVHYSLQRQGSQPSDMHAPTVKGTELRFTRANVIDQVLDQENVRNNKIGTGRPFTKPNKGSQW